MDDVEIIREFLIESTENLARLDQEMIELEQRPGDAALLASIFRTIHTIKGTCGFLGFSTLEGITHVAENLLSQLRNRERDLTPDLVTLILATVDAVRTMLATIEATGHESADTYSSLKARLQTAVNTPAAAAEPSPATLSIPAAAEPEDGPTANRAPAAAESTIRVDVGLLDRLVTMVGELVLARNQILQVPVSENPALHATSQRLDLITSELQEGIMRTRMQPVGVVWNKLPRVVRDLAAACGKQIAIEMEGASTEIDKTIIEAIKDPLTHIVRNACDHGLEDPDQRTAKGKPACGRLNLRAWHEGGYVKIEISDDGAGINPEVIRRKAVQKGLLRADQADRLGDRDAIQLVFAPGFSTAERITNISGRGVGMDVVRTNVEKIGGSLDLSSVVDEGTSVQIRIPLTLAIIPGLLVHCRGQRFIIPQVSLLELVHLEGQGREAIQTIHGSSVYRRRGRLIPLVDLRDVLKLGTAQATVDGEEDVVDVVILQAEQHQFGLVVDSISDTQEIVVKALGRQLKDVSCYAGATIMGDGQVALILDVMGIAKLAGILGNGSSTAVEATSEATADSASDAARSWLLFRASAPGRMAVPLDLVARLEEVPLDKVEYAASKMALQYRGELLPLISLSDALGLPESGQLPELLKVIVVSRSNRSIGVIVEEILDVVEERLGKVARSSRHAVLGSTVLDGKLTDLVDLAAVIESAEPGWFGDSGPEKHPTILLADTSSFSRSFARNALEVEGYRVLEAGTQEEVLHWLGRRNVDAVLLGGGVASPETSHAAPVLPWAGPGSDRHAMLESLQNLLAAVACERPQEVA